MIAVCISNFLAAQDLTGSWYGILDLPGNKLRINFHIKATGQDFTTTMDSPDQGAKGIPMDKTTVRGSEVLIETAKMGMTYKATFDPASNELKGSFTQGPGSIPLNLSRKEKSNEKAVLKRPQDPASFPYQQEEVTFKNKRSGNELAGTLTLPKDGKVSKIVILISGSGPQDRNEEVAQFNHRPFLVWSDYLTKKGIGVLRYDDRGVGKSTGTFATATSADFADDAEAAVEFIQSRQELKGLKIGLIGHSEGGMIAPMVASRNPAVKFIVLLAGPGIPISELMVEQNRDQMKLAGVSDSVIAATSTTNRRLYQAVVNLKGLNEQDFKTKLEAVLFKELRNNNTEHASEAVIAQQVNSNVKQFDAPWFKYFLAFNPQTYLSKVKCPLLAINGTLDMQVSSESNLKGIKESMIKAGNKNFEIFPIKNLNHLLQLAKTGSLAEYAQLEETVNPQALDKVAVWIAKQ